MINAVTTARQFAELERARLDFQVLRVQFFLGFLCAAAAFLIMFGHARTLDQDPSQRQQSISERLGSKPPTAALIKPSQSPIDLALNQCDSLLAQRFSFAPISLTTYLAALLLVGLIVLEIFGKTGNRIGAVPAIWSMFLFGLWPNASWFVQTSYLRGELLDALFILFASFCVLRFDLTRETKLVLATAAGLALTIFEIYFQATSLFQPASSLPAPTVFTGESHCNFSKALLGSQDVRLIAFMIFLLGMLAAGRFLSKGAPLRVRVATIVSLAVIILSYVFSCGTFSSSLQTFQSAPLSLCAGAALCILLSVAPWYASGACPSGKALKFNLAAIAFLSAICLFWLSQAL